MPGRARRQTRKRTPASDMAAMQVADGPPRIHAGMAPRELTVAIAKYKSWFKEDSKIAPHEGPVLDRQDFIDSQAYFREEEMHRRRDGKIAHRLALVGFPKHSSTTPLRQLEKITISQMLVRKTHVGQYLLCRSIAPVVRVGAVQLVIEDPEGRTAAMSLYNFPTTLDCSMEYADLLFPVGLILAVREPTYKPASQGPIPILRQDSPTDIVVVDPRDEILTGVTWKTGLVIRDSPPVPNAAEGWKELGNKHFKNGHLLPAVFAYSNGLRVEPEYAALRSNRAEVYLRLKFWSGALADARHVNRMSGVPDSLRSKVLFREARAEYARDNFETALEKFAEFLKVEPEYSGLSEWIARATLRAEQKRTGNYDWALLFRTSLQDKHLDVADYRGPIEVRSMEHRGGGRGVVATRDMRTGELLLVSKPFVSVFDSDLSPKETLKSIDFLSGNTWSPAETAAVNRAAQTLYGNPDLRDAIFDLYAGPDFPSPPTSYSSRRPDEPIAVDPLSPTVDIDIARLEAICVYNWFNITPVKPFASPPSDEETPCGLYLLSSLFNHSCMANANWHCIGDVMVIRAMQEIKAGEEITIPYTENQSYIERCDDLKKHMLEKCDCWLCEEDRKDGEEALQRRHCANEDVWGKYQRLTLEQARTLESTIDGTYSKSRGVVRPALAFIKHKKAELMRASSRTPATMRRAIEADIQALEYLGYVVVDAKPESAPSTSSKDPAVAIATDRIPSTMVYGQPLLIMIRLMEQYLLLDDKINARRWLMAARWVVNTVHGGGNDMFMALLGSTLQAMKVDAFVRSIL